MQRDASGRRLSLRCTWGTSSSGENRGLGKGAPQACLSSDPRLLSSFSLPRVSIRKQRKLLRMETGSKLSLALLDPGLFLHELLPPSLLFFPPEKASHLTRLTVVGIESLALQRILAFCLSAGLGQCHHCPLPLA